MDLKLTCIPEFRCTDKSEMLLDSMYVFFIRFEHAKFS